MRRTALEPLSAAKAALIRELLRDRKTRDAERLLVVEGVKPVRELVQAKDPLLQAVVASAALLDKHDDWPRLCARSAAPLYICRTPVFEKLSELQTAAGVLAIVRQPAWDQDAVFARPRLFGLYGEALQDPTNVGAIVRTALGFGLDALWLSPDSADVFNPKVVRTSAGAVLRWPVFSLHDMELFGRHGCTLLAAEPPRKESAGIRELTVLPARAILAVGNESRGLSPRVLARAAVRFHIPLAGGVESLNVAASVAVAAFYLSALGRRDES